MSVVKNRQVGPATAAELLDLLISPGENAELGWIIDALVPALGGVPVRQLAPTLHGSE